MFHFKGDKQTSILNIGRRIENLYLSQINESSSIEEKMVAMFKICNIIAYELRNDDLTFCNEIKFEFDHERKVINVYTKKEQLKALLIGRDGINSRNLHNVLVLISLITGDEALEKLEKYDIEIDLHPKIKEEVEKKNKDIRERKNKIFDKKKEEQKKREEDSIITPESNKEEGIVKGEDEKGKEKEKEEGGEKRKDKKNNRLILNLNENLLVRRIKELTLIIYDNKLGEEEKKVKLEGVNKEFLKELYDIDDKIIYSLLKNNVNYIINESLLGLLKKYDVTSVLRINSFFSKLVNLTERNLKIALENMKFFKSEK